MDDKNTLYDEFMKIHESMRVYEQAYADLKIQFALLLDRYAALKLSSRDIKNQ